MGFARIEGLNALADCGVKNARKHKNTECLGHAKKLIDLHQPEVIVLENTADRKIRRYPRVRRLTKQLIALGKKRNVPVVLLDRKEVHQIFFPDSQGTKHQLAEILAERYPDELARRLPPKRRAWMTEDHRMGIFTAVALALAFNRRRNTR